MNRPCGAGRERQKMNKMKKRLILVGIIAAVALLVFRYTWLIEHDYPEDIRRARLQTQWVCKSGIGRTAPAES